jgi:hypothetical protein
MEHLKEVDIIHSVGAWIAAIQGDSIYLSI